MKTTIFILLVTLTSLKTITMSAQNRVFKTHEQELIELVEQTFAQGALNKLEIQELKRGFHPDFSILIPKGKELSKLSLVKWIEIVKQYKDSQKKLDSGIRNLDYTINVLDMTDSIAVVKTQFFKGNVLVITDYLSYIRFEDSWQAVSKISKEHIYNPLKIDF